MSQSDFTTFFDKSFIHFFLRKSLTEEENGFLFYWPTDIQTSSYPLTHQDAGDKGVADKCDHWCHLTTLSVFLCFTQTQQHIYLETLRSRHRCHDLMYWNVHFTSTENAGQYQTQRTDKPSNKDSSLDVWSHKETVKSQSRQPQNIKYTAAHRKNCSLK